VAQSWHDPVAEKWGQRVRQVLRRERIRKVKRSQEFIHSLLVGTRVRGRYFDNGGSGICRIEFSSQPTTNEGMNRAGLYPPRNTARNPPRSLANLVQQSVVRLFPCPLPVLATLDLPPQSDRFAIALTCKREGPPWCLSIDAIDTSAFV
jgi:hypothetical protein